MTVTDHDMRDQVAETLGSEGAWYDVPAIVAELQERYGVASIKAMDVDWYWAVVLRHCTDPRAASNVDAAAVEPWTPKRAGGEYVTHKHDGRTGVTMFEYGDPAVAPLSIGVRWNGGRGTWSYERVGDLRPTP